MPIGLRRRLDAVDAGGSMSYFAADLQIHQGNGEERSGWRSLASVRVDRGAAPGWGLQNGPQGPQQSSSGFPPARSYGRCDRCRDLEIGEGELLSQAQLHLGSIAYFSI